MFPVIKMQCVTALRVLAKYRVQFFLLGRLSDPVNSYFHSAQCETHMFLKYPQELEMIIKLNQFR